MEAYGPHASRPGTRKGMSMRRIFFAAASLAVTLAFAAAAFADVKVTDQTYVRHDGGGDDVISNCFNDGPGTTFGGNRQQNEPAIAIKQDEPAFMVAGANDYCGVPAFGDSWEGVYVSDDGGETWTDSLLPGYPGDTSEEGQDSPIFGINTAAGDPIMDWDNDGNLFVGGISFNRTVPTGNAFKTNGNVYVATYERDPGAPLGIDYMRNVIVGRGTPGAFPAAGRFNDKPSLKVDDWTSSPQEGNLYVAWAMFPGSGQNQVLFSRSTDNGQTFSRPFKLSKGTNDAQGADIAVAPNGAIYVVWRSFAVNKNVPNAIVYVKSTNGGLSFTDPRTIRTIVGYDRSDTYASDGSAPDCGDGIFLCLSSFVFHRTNTLPNATADDNGNVYVTWEALTPSGDNGDTYHPDGQSQVVVTKSSNGGTSWNNPVKADPHALGHQYWPNIEYDKSADQLALIYYDSREDPSYSVNRPPGNVAGGTSVCGVPASATCDVLNAFIATSSDGVTWSPTKVSSVGHQPEYEMFGNRDDPFHGDYLWVDAAGGTVYGVWADNRDVVPGSDPRETTQDGFDVHQCRAPNPDGSFGPDTCPNAGGLNANIFGAILGP
jgi:hypothetical protein